MRSNDRLSQVEKPVWPRTITTHSTDERQVLAEFLLIDPADPRIQTTWSSGVNMNTTARKLSIFAFMTVATTPLSLSASTTFAVSNSHIHHHIHLMSSEYFPTFSASNTHTHNHHMQLMSNGPNSPSTYGVGSGALPP